MDFYDTGIDQLLSDLQRARFVDYTGCGDLRQNYSAIFVANNGDVWLWHSGNGCRRIVHQDNGEMTSTVFKTRTGQYAGQ